MKFDDEEPTVEELIAQIPYTPFSAVKTAEAAHAAFGRVLDIEESTDPAALAARVPRSAW